jgi:hypothetical protein
MRAFVFGAFSTMAVLLPTTGNAQAFQFRTPPPRVTAAAADWQINSDPMMVAGLVYHPTRSFRFFDGQVMVQIGVTDGVPVYADTTLEPYSIVYVPVSRDRVREYERRRDGELAGTTGSRLPSFPGQSPSDQALRLAAAGAMGATGTAGALEPSLAGSPLITTPRWNAAAAAVGTSGGVDDRAVSVVGTGGAADRGLARRTLVETIPRPSGANGVWLEFNGARWYADGPATTFSPDRFVPAGQYRGFPVYREKSAENDVIWIEVVKDGPLAPYVRR